MEGDMSEADKKVYEAQFDDLLGGLSGKEEPDPDMNGHSNEHGIVQNGEIATMSEESYSEFSSDSRVTTQTHTQVTEDSSTVHSTVRTETTHTDLIDSEEVGTNIFSSISKQNCNKMCLIVKISAAFFQVSHG